ncbi:related to Heterokaryon incompatibility protein s [Fusarium oxysporum]|uniref:Related to Heterokaryon incompatibility protein s n=1 Tax=Fusarium oxysporum TaxID=5507 RepID=A0A2H3SPV5_FUSOX|nr:related to Heterokaryon incompatibility protein s [Fusarium oxysporum]
MAEIFGVVASALSVAALFNNVVDCFEYIQLGRNFGEDYQTCQVKLDIARLRLSRWGDAVKINNDSRFTEVKPSNNQVRVAKNTLEQLLNLFRNAHTESSNFKLGAGEEELALFDPSTNTNQAVVALRNTMRDLAHKRQKTTSLSKKISWALYKQKAFMRLIEDIQELLDGLEAIFPQREAYKRMVEIEIEEVGQGPGLQVLSDAAQETDDLLQEAASRRLEALSSSNTIDQAKVAGTAKVKVGNEYIFQAVPSRTGITTNKIGDLDAQGRSRVLVGDSHGTKGFMDSD